MILILELINLILTFIIIVLLIIIFIMLYKVSKSFDTLENKYKV
jgi:hypothetical protein